MTGEPRSRVFAIDRIEAVDPARSDDGTWGLTMTVVGATEVEPWVLSWGPHVTLVEPADMRSRVKANLRGTLDRYGQH